MQKQVGEISSLINANINKTNIEIITNILGEARYTNEFTSDTLDFLAKGIKDVLGYKVMEIAKWDSDTKTLHWKQKKNIEDALKQIEYDKEEAFEKGIKQGEIKGEINKIQTMFRLGISEEKFVPELKFLTQEPIKNKLDNNLNYIKEHLTYSEDQICTDLNLLGDIT